MDIDEMKNHGTHPQWSWWDLFLVLVTLLTAMGFIAMFKNVIRELVTVLVDESQRQAVLLFISSFIQAAVMMGSTIAFARRRGAKASDLGLIKGKLGKNLMAGVMGGLALTAVIWILGALWTSVLGPPPPQDIEQVLNNLVKSDNFFLPFLSVAVLAPLSEELYFRGMIYPVARKRFGPFWGMVISGLFFGSMHLDIYRLIPISAGGMVLAYYYEKTGSLISPMLAHSIWNSIMMLSLYMVKYLT